MDEDDDDDDAALLLRVAQSSHTELPVGTRYHLPSSAKGGRTLKATTMPARTHQQQPRQSNRHPHNGKKSRGGGSGRSAFARNVVSRRAQTDPLPDLQPTMKLDLISYLPPPAPPRDGVDVQLGERCARRLRQSSRQGESEPGGFKPRLGCYETRSQCRTRLVSWRRSPILESLET
ncbi:uncharacterized protein [Physcomitrium patens]|uniref:Uncharacterized protein n=1 Tax=Physcomitrium patens TaxID=3218 RepID=A0A2K1J4X6_PHYPA|nr:uncharacterized protein LOC112294360 [Physcomitrium patens]PNR36584.1 hypothetical protein PHYPA_022435 [Physcomitrium patens]|eukprot:XP_024400454.1 uncharacterized protein LOC112294360 [Physcomitrella patens]